MSKPSDKPAPDGLVAVQFMRLVDAGIFHRVAMTIAAAIGLVPAIIIAEQGGLNPAVYRPITRYRALWAGKAQIRRSIRGRHNPCRTLLNFDDLVAQARPAGYRSRWFPLRFLELLGLQSSNAAGGPLDLD